jgi:hypothetical protein
MPIMHSDGEFFDDALPAGASHHSRRSDRPQSAQWRGQSTTERAPPFAKMVTNASGNDDWTLWVLSLAVVVVASLYWYLTRRERIVLDPNSKEQKERIRQQRLLVLQQQDVDHKEQKWVKTETLLDDSPSSATASVVTGSTAEDLARNLLSIKSDRSAARKISQIRIPRANQNPFKDLNSVQSKRWVRQQRMRALEDESAAQLPQSKVERSPATCKDTRSDSITTSPPLPCATDNGTTAMAKSVDTSIVGDESNDSKRTGPSDSWDPKPTSELASGSPNSPLSTKSTVQTLPPPQTPPIQLLCLCLSQIFAHDVTVEPHEPSGAWGGHQWRQSRTANTTASSSSAKSDYSSKPRLTLRLHLYYSKYSQQETRDGASILDHSWEALLSVLSVLFPSTTGDTTSGGVHSVTKKHHTCHSWSTTLRLVPSTPGTATYPTGSASL